MKHIISLFIAVLIFSACTEKMDINVDDATPQLVIYGSITTDTMQHRISITTSSNYFSNTAPEGISNAIVTISDGDIDFPLTESPAEKGIYLTAADVFGVEGKIYTLKVVVDFNGITDEYEATSILPYSIDADSVVLSQSGNAVDALLYGKFPESDNNYLNIIAYKNNNIPLNNKLSNFRIIVSENTDNKEIDAMSCMKIAVGSDNSDIFIEHGDLLDFHICSITKEYADYVLAVQKELQWSIPIFSGPPTNVQTNIIAGNPSVKVPVCGFFTAYSKKNCKILFE